MHASLGGMPHECRNREYSQAGSKCAPVRTVASLHGLCRDLKSRTSHLIIVVLGAEEVLQRARISKLRHNVQDLNPVRAYRSRGTNPVVMVLDDVVMVGHARQESDFG